MVKCCECGFLAVRHSPTRDLREAETDYREALKKPALGPHQSIEHYPLCFRRKLDFQARAIGAELKDKQEHVLDLIQEDRECESFTPWQRGFTPKEHAEMIWEQERRDLQRESTEADRRWREEQAEREHAWRVQQAERERQWRQEDVELTKAALKTNIGVTLLAAVVGFAAAMAAVLFQQLLAQWFSGPQ